MGRGEYQLTRTRVFESMKKGSDLKTFSRRWTYEELIQLCNKNKELILYLFFGGVTFLISVTSFEAFYLLFGLNELVANVLSWCIAVLFAFLSNQKWVFRVPKTNGKSLLRQLLSFLGGRIITLAVEEIMLMVFISYLHFPSLFVKVTAQIIVIVLNYIISKWFVFNTSKFE